MPFHSIFFSSLCHGLFTGFFIDALLCSALHDMYPRVRVLAFMELSINVLLLRPTTLRRALAVLSFRPVACNTIRVLDVYFYI